MKYFLTLIFFVLPVAWSTRVNANYVTAKTFLLYLGSSLALMFLADKLSLRKIPKTLLWLGGLTIAYQFVFYAQAFSYFNFLYAFKYLSFLFLLAYFYGLDLKPESFLKDCDFLIALMFGFIAMMTFAQIQRQFDTTATVNTGMLLSTFGNVNMFSEFLILTLPLFFFWQRLDTKIYRPIKLVLLFFVVFFLLFCSSRSAWIGLALWVVFKIWQRLDKMEWGVFAAGVAAYFGARMLLINGGMADAVKLSSSQERMALYKGSIGLLSSNPFGIEPGRFLSEIVPFMGESSQHVNEYSFFDQPHSEILKWGIQFGWPMLALALAFLAALFFFCAKAFWSSERKARTNTQSLFLESFIVLVPQMLFQFPFENPASLLFLAFILGLYLSSFPLTKTFDVSKVRAVLAVVALAGLMNAFFFISSVYLESNFAKSPDIMKLACGFYPDNFKACFWKDLAYVDNKQFAAFKNEFKADMRPLPLYPDYIRLLPNYFNGIKDAKSMCESVNIYTFLYKGQQNYSPEVTGFCKSTPAPFNFNDTENFRANYEKWLNL